jgi:hypothetical protein
MRHHVVRFGVLVACLTLGFGVGLAGADETCNSPYIAKLIKGQEDYGARLGPGRRGRG